MRVLQLIDSLRPGGAEKMAVNIANALLLHVEGSFLCCTRQEGMLKDQIKPEVGYLFLDKRSSLDPKAIFNLRKYIQENKIEIVHAHSTSYFLAGLLKLTGGEFKLIWHDHYGESDNLQNREFKVLKKFSRYFSGIVAVNTALKEWAVTHLECKNVIEIKNFVPEPDSEAVVPFKLKGNEDAFKIICVANLRPQKDHFNLLKAYKSLDNDKNISLHIIGEDPGTSYSASVLSAIKNSPVHHKIFYYGVQHDIIPLLKQADLGILSSRSEGLPLALLEYGSAGLPVICTKVGKCGEIIGSAGKLVERENSSALADKILDYFYNKNIMLADAERFHQRVIKFSEKEVLPLLLQIYKKC